jgi:microcystin-dependent protein
MLLASGPLYSTTGRATTLHPETVSPAGGSERHTNVQPFLALGYCIATRGARPRGN